jgi:hypothetical protein
MKCLALLTLLLLLAACSDLWSPKFDNRDFAVDTYSPKPNELQLGEQRARRYWERNSGRLGPEPRYLAVQASHLLQGELGSNTWPKLIASETTASFFNKGCNAELDAYSVVIFDTKKDHLVGPQGYVFVDLPTPGEVVRVANYVARYIGTGR